ncbi:MAG TPA: AAA family ATPase [Candidatus Acidoferrales bacterium]|nr:AAA family ATPase [Candidatus Acidoferrales bacterium]
MLFEGAPPLEESTIEISFSVPRQELLEMMLRSQGTQFYIPYPTPGSEFARSIGFSDDSEASGRNLAGWFLSRDGHTFSLIFKQQQGNGRWDRATVPSFGAYSPALRDRCVIFTLRPNGELATVGYQPSESDIGVQLVSAFKERIYGFRAERLNVGECGVGNSRVLYPNAANLPAVLMLLQNNKVRFDQFNKVVQAILPQVPRISVRPTSGNAQVLEILVWPFESQPDREDLTVPLKDSGTGLGQVLAMLYVVLASRRHTVIVIDEPQSFLHPGAARKLIEVLRNHPEHQYIIATHSPSAISAAEPRTVTVARLESGETVLQQVNIAEARAQETLLAELGARLSDVFGSDSVLWVEGRTEEECYGKIYRGLVQKPLMGVQILGVRHTGDLEGDAAERVIEIYNKISASGSLIPPAVGFLFDSECRSVQKKEELVTKSKGLLRFIPRRMYENYLLRPAAIAAVANAIENFNTREITADEVGKLSVAMLTDPQFYCGNVLPAVVEERISKVNAKRLLRELFNRLSDTRVRYDEVVHGTVLTEWLVKNSPADLKEIGDLLDSLLAAKRS